MTRSFRAKSLLVVVFALVVLILGVQNASAQATGRVEGIVTDSSGAPIPGVTVTATNVGTNVSRVEVTNTDGVYSITPLAVGNYRIQADLSGFQSTVSELELSVNQVARVDFTIQPGVSETVTVTAEAPLIDKTTSYIGTVIEEEQVENLPLNGRNITQLATLVPGVNRGIPGSNAAGGGSGTDAETFRYSEFGSIALSANGLREQFNNYMIEGLDNNETLVNSIAYIPSPEAVREFGVITTTAPAEFGRAGGLVQNMVLKSGTNAIDGALFYFIRPESLAAKPEFAVEKPDFNNEDFGATIGGPIFRDRTFFFGSYHGLRNSIPVEAGNYVTVPTQRMRNGDFGELLDPAVSGLPAARIIYDPLTGVPFPNNVIPPERINPVGRAYLNVFPLPTRAGVTRNFLTERQKESTYDDFDFRVDHTLSQSDQLFFSFSNWDDQFSDPGRIPGYQAGFGAGTSTNNGSTIRLGESHVFGNDLINELRVGYTDFEFGFLPVGFGIDQNAELGIPGTGGITTPNGISLIGGGDGFFIEYLGDFGQYLIGQRTMQISDSVTWLRDTHTFKVGGTLMRRELSQQRTQFGKGFYFFRTDAGFAPGFTGYEVSDMLIGHTDFTATGVPGYVPRNAISWENAVYVQDDWHIRPNLTLNLGLRWDVFTPYYEEDDQLANYDPFTQRLVLPDEGGASRSTLDTDMDNFGPRLGFNYLLSNTTSLRGGYGIFYSLDRGGIDRQLTENPPAVVTEFRFGGAPGSHVSLWEPIPLPTPVNPNSPELPQGSGLVYIPRDSETTEVQQWSLSVQQELGNNMSGMLAYVGTRGDNLATNITSSGFAGDVAGRLSTTMYIGESSYDSLQATVRRNPSNGLAFLASYTYGDARNNTPGFYTGSPSRGGTVTDADCAVDPEETCDLSLDEGPADYDVRHRFTFAGTYDLPFAQGNALLGGWSVNTVLTLQTGTPFTIYSDFGGIKRANQNGNPNDGPEDVDEWFDTSVFSPAAGSQTQGTAERNSVRGPGTRILDLSLFKTFDFARAGSLQFRIEGFNILNEEQYSQPNQVVVDPNFGKITGTRLNSERQVQLALRYLF